MEVMNNMPDEQTQVIKDALLWQINEHFYPEEDLGNRRIEFHKGDDWISISITANGLNFTGYTISKFDKAIKPLGYKFNGMWCGYNRNRLVFILHVIKED